MNGTLKVGPRLLLYVCLSVFVGDSAFAAPPSITYFYPAGARHGTTIDVTATGSFDKWPIKVWASGEGITVRPATDKGKLSVTVAADAVPGTYWLRGYNEDGASALRPFIVGSLPEVTEKEPNEEPKAAQPISENCVVNGRLEKAGDVDSFALSLKKGQTFVASLEANAALRSPMDAVLQIVSADGFVLDQNHDFHGLDPQIAFTAPKAGTYVARVFAFPSAPDSSIRFAGAESYIYRLTLTTGGYADFPLPLAATRNQPGIVTLAGWNIPEAARNVPVKSQPGDFTSVFHPAAANSVRLRLESHVCFDLTARPQPPLSLSPPFSATARIEKPAAEVAIPFTAKKGQSLSVQVQSRGLGLAVNPILRVLDAEKKPLARAEPPQVNSDTAVSFTPPADGPYTVAVTDLYGGGGPRHAFLLRVTLQEPDYELTLAADRFVVPPGKSLDIPVKIVRRNGYAKTVEVAAEGLPDGVKWELKPTTGKPDPNAAALTFSAEKAGLGGPFRIVGRVKDEPTFTRAARAPIPEYETSTADLWVTVSDATPTPPTPKKK